MLYNYLQMSLLRFLLFHNQEKVIDLADLLQLNRDNILENHICCAMSDPKNQNGVRLKKEWLQCRFEEGLVFKKLDVKGKVFIEYVPAENAWVPIDAPGYMFINCMWVAGRYKSQGYGAKLLNECMNDSKDKHGIVVISSHKKKPYLAEKSFFIHNGFEVIDTAPPYFELLVKKLNPHAPAPKFKPSAKQTRIDQTDGLVVMYTDQCPFTDYYTNDVLDDIQQEYQIPITKIKLVSKEAAQNAPSAYTTFAAFYNGSFLTHEILNKSKIDKLLKSVPRNDS